MDQIIYTIMGKHIQQNPCKHANHPWKHVQQNSARELDFLCANPSLAPACCNVVEAFGTNLTLADDCNLVTLIDLNAIER